jgi:hypothetical protein
MALKVASQHEVGHDSKSNCSGMFTGHSMPIDQTSRHVGAQSYKQISGRNSAHPFTVNDGPFAQDLHNKYGAFNSTVFTLVTTFYKVE